jgi:SAM-dependent methyltransferase
MSKPFSITSFYNGFHHKSGLIKKLIDPRDFTYRYILGFLHLPLIWGAKNTKALDVGCGIGNIALYLSQQCSIVVGVDISPKAIRLAKANAKNLKIINVKFLTGSIRDIKGKFDLIVCSEVIEHIADDAAFVRDISARLNKHGYLVLSTPLNASLFYKLGLFDKFDLEVGHLRRYSPDSITRLIEGQKLQIEQFKIVEGPIRSVMFLSRLKIFLKFIRPSFSKLVCFVDELLGKVFGYSNIIILAQKK